MCFDLFRALPYSQILFALTIWMRKYAGQEVLAQGHAVKMSRLALPAHTHCTGLDDSCSH